MRSAPALLVVLCCLFAAGPAAAHDAPATAPAPQSPWCGDERSTDDTAHQAPLRRHRLRALYLVPRDAPSRLATVAPAIQGQVDQASATLERDRGRALRFDRGTRCGQQYVDITTIRLPLSTGELQQAADTDTTLARVGRALAARGLRIVPDDELFTPRNAGTTNVVAWLDGPAPAASCGQSTIVADTRRTARNANALGGKLALIFRDGDAFCGGQTVLHEVAHMLGAVPDGAPHATPDGHCDDAAEDLMCVGGPVTGLAPGTVDAGSDDYWDPPAGAPLRWWTLNLSPFLCARPTCAGDAPAPTRARNRARRAFRR